MSRNPSSAGRSQGLAPLPPWLIIAIFLAILGVTWWQTHNVPSRAPANSRTTSRTSDEWETAGDRDTPIDVEVSDPGDDIDSSNPSQPPGSKHEAHDTGSHAAHDVHPKRSESKPQVALHSARIEDQIIRSQDGRIVFEGTIDLQPTLDRIEHGGQNSHRNDGTTFQNRERRLPAKPSGYYKEYVHPTHGISGPGPQRIIVGKDGDMWYTPDHYKTFRRLP